MKNLTFTIILSVVSSVVMAFTTISRFVIVESLEIESSRPLALVIETPKIKAEVLKPAVKNHIAFLDAVGMRESSGNYKAVNQFGYLGKYQFGRQTLNNLGYEDITNREFLSSPSIQEAAMKDLLKHNKKILKRFIENYEGKVINGVYITESGILAAAHLAGPGNVKKFFRKGYEFKDGNGTKMTSYMKKFSGYQLDI